MNFKRNCLSYWYPKICDVVPTPRTIIYRTTVPLVRIFDGVKPEGWDEFIYNIGKATDVIGYPAFIRTGHTAGKHDWVKTCFLPSRNDLEAHIVSIIEYSEMASIIGLPIDVWVVRELLPTKPLGTAFLGMPICKEFRVFVDDGEVMCWHCYWPKEAFRKSVPEWYDDLCKIEDADKQIVLDYAVKAGKVLGGAWSVDVLHTEQGWYVTDMAKAEDSWHWPDCPNGKGRTPIRTTEAGEIEGWSVATKRVVV
jgi:hypothetical protein